MQEQTQASDCIDRLMRNGDLTDREWKALLESDGYDRRLQTQADAVRRKIYGDEVYIRGLIEFTDHCKNNCYYCGIRAGNAHAARYRMDKEQILSCCQEGWELGFRTFVLQGGEDPYFTDERICDLVATIRKIFPECAITLSIGEKKKESYRAYFDAGANRYLLRHETADARHYGKLHPGIMSAENRKRCLFDLKEIGYQVGSGFMVGSPFQTTENLISDLRFLRKLEPDMIGIGPFIHHRQTPFADQPDGSLELTLRLISVLRLMFPRALIPATTALGTIAPDGRERGLQAGANVVMPNLSPPGVREKYALYENKLCTGEEAAQSKALLEEKVKAAGYRVVTTVGNAKTIQNE